MVGGLEETSDSAITGQSILARIGERLSAMVIPAESLPPSSLLPSSPFSFLPSLFSFHRLCLSHFSFVISHFYVFLISHLSFLILSSFSFLICYFVAQISANVNIYRIDSSFLHIICAFLA